MVNTIFKKHPTTLKQDLQQASKHSQNMINALERLKRSKDMYNEKKEIVLNMVSAHEKFSTFLNSVLNSYAKAPPIASTPKDMVQIHIKFMDFIEVTESIHRVLNMFILNLLNKLSEERRRLIQKEKTLQQEDKDNKRIQQKLSNIQTQYKQKLNTLNNKFGTEIDNLVTQLKETDKMTQDIIKIISTQNTKTNTPPNIGLGF